jgi:hypothetical protein
MLALLIPGKESLTSENVDTYLALVVEELLELWEGIKAVDVSSEGSDCNFSLRTILMWCIHDYPAYGLASGQVTKGYRACPECGPNVSTRHSASLEKNVYLGHRRYLQRNHPYCRLKRAFDGSEELRPPPAVLTGRNHIVRFARKQELWLNASPENKPRSAQDQIHETRVKRLSILYKLPY